MKSKFTGALLGVFMLAMVLAPTAASAQTFDRDSLIEILRDLVERLMELRDQQSAIGQEIQSTKEEFRSYIQEGLEQGMTSEDVREIQQVLASDSTLYPEGLVTGFFGPLTTAAVRRFQARFGLEVTGVVDEETKAAFDTLLEERFQNRQVPPGLLNAPGIMKKFESRLEYGCDDDVRGKAPFCKKIKLKYRFDDDDGNDDEDDDSNDDEDDGNAMEEADEQISEAEAAIAALEDAIASSTASSSDIEEAQSILDSANDHLSDANEKYADGEYAEAEEKADEAEDKAKEGLELLGVSYSSSDESDDDDDEDDDSSDDDDDEDDD